MHDLPITHLQVKAYKNFTATAQWEGKKNEHSKSQQFNRAEEEKCEFLTFLHRHIPPEQKLAVASGKRYTQTEERNNVFYDGKSPLMHCAKKTRNRVTTDASLGSLPERCPLDVGVVVIIVQHQNTFLKEKRIQ